MNTLSIYHHCHLNPFKIRLMTLLPDTFGSDLQSHLARYTLNEAKDYDALSYVWGKIEDRARHLLHVNGYPVILTANLYHALQHIRDPAEPAILWVDAICINQNDTTERGSQVLLMRNIYSGAKQVVSWLGVPSMDVRVVTEFIAELDREDDGELNHVSILQSVFDPKFLNKWQAILYLFSFPYWKRGWIIQEVVCARKLLKCGR